MEEHRWCGERFDDVGLAFVNIHDQHNLGDQVCCPADYFHDWRNALRLDAWKDDLGCSQRLIFGGGGMIHGQLERALMSVGDKAKVSPIAWGIGHNSHDLKHKSYECLEKFALVGCRDFGGHDYDYVPCVSCLHPAFNAKLSNPVLPFVVYEHHAHPINLPWFAKENNNHSKQSFSAILEFLSLGERVLTNTYHGAYWAMLLNKPVVIWKPFSTRFSTFKHQPRFCDESNWKDVLMEAELPPKFYIDECKEINWKFATKVRTALDAASP